MNDTWHPKISSALEKESYFSTRKLSPVNTAKCAFTNKIFFWKAVCVLLKCCDCEDPYRIWVQSLSRMTLFMCCMPNSICNDIVNRNTWGRCWQWLQWHKICNHTRHIYPLIHLFLWICSHSLQIHILFTLCLWICFLPSVIWSILILQLCNWFFVNCSKDLLSGKRTQKRVDKFSDFEQGPAMIRLPFSWLFRSNEDLLLGSSIRLLYVPTSCLSMSILSFLPL